MLHERKALRTAFGPKREEVKEGGENYTAKTSKFESLLNLLCSARGIRRPHKKIF
jgi:hypothetical protein